MNLGTSVDHFFGIYGAPTTIAHMAHHHCALELKHHQYLRALYSYSYRLLYSVTSFFTSAQQLLTHGAIAGVRAIRSAAFVVANLLVSLMNVAIRFTAAKAAYGSLFIVLAIAWQVYYPLRVTLRLVSRLRWFGGFVFEFTPQQHVRTREGYVALTLNSGPSPYSTDAILAVLDQYDAHATFFVSSSQVEKCDVIGAGSGVEGLGKAILAKMLAEGHQLAALANPRPTGWQGCWLNTLPRNHLLQELSNCSKLIAAAQRHHAAVHDVKHAAAAAHVPTNGTANLKPKAGPCKWFRPQDGLLTPSMAKAARKLGYTAVLAGVFPWDNVLKWPYWNALYVWSKVYTGAIIMLNEGPQLLPTLQHILPWLHTSGYKIVALDTAAAMSRTAESLGKLTSNTLEAHNRSYSLKSSSSCDADVLIAARAGSADSPTQDHSLSGSVSPGESPAAVVQLLQAEESEKLRLKAAKRAEADRRAGIDRQLASMSAAEKRAAERKERERKEAEKRRAQRAEQEKQAQQRYEKYVRRKAEQEVLLEREKAAAIDAWRQRTLDHVGTEIEEVQPTEAGHVIANQAVPLEGDDHKMQPDNEMQLTQSMPGLARTLVTSTY